MAALPKVIYVAEERGSDGSTWLNATRQLFDAAADDGSERVVGVYKLVETKRVKRVVQVR